MGNDITRSKIKLSNCTVDRTKIRIYMHKQKRDGEKATNKY